VIVDGSSSSRYDDGAPTVDPEADSLRGRGSMASWESDRRVRGGEMFRHRPQIIQTRDSEAVIERCTGGGRCVQRGVGESRESALASTGKSGSKQH
jgi:hypothetical protein